MASTERIAPVVIQEIRDHQLERKSTETSKNTY